MLSSNGTGRITRISEENVRPAIIIWQLPSTRQNEMIVTIMAEVDNGAISGSIYSQLPTLSFVKDGSISVTPRISFDRVCLIKDTYLRVDMEKQPTMNITITRITCADIPHHVSR